MLIINQKLWCWQFRMDSYHTVVIFKEFFGHFTTFYGNSCKLATIRQKNLRQTTIVFDNLRKFTIFDVFLWRPRSVTSFRQFFEIFKNFFSENKFLFKSSIYAILRHFSPFFAILRKFSNFSIGWKIPKIEV